MDVQKIAEQIVNSLNEAFDNDELAIKCLISNKVPCTRKLAYHPHMIAAEDKANSGYTLSTLGIINGILLAAGLPKIAAKYSDDKDPKMLGFQIYDKT